MSAPEYAELQVTSNFTFLRGGSHAKELVGTAKALGLSAIAITDRNTISGIVRAHVAAKEFGLQFIVGARLDFSDGTPSLLCFPTDRAAYGRLTKLLSMGQLRTTKGQCDLRYGDLEAHGEGQIFIVLPPAKLDDGFTERLQRLRADFPRHVYLGASRYYGAQDLKRLSRLNEVAWAARAPMVATGDVLYHTPERRALQDVLTCIREKCTIQEAGFRLEANAERHLKPPAEMARLFSAHPEAIARTMEIAARCTFSLDELKYEYPDEPVPPGKTAQQHLTDLTWEGAATRYPNGVPEKVRAQLAKELAFIEERGIPQYFLTVHDIVRWARTGPEKPILCQGRGSAANSAVCYCLGVTAVNPDKVELLFERFLSKERNEPPDIDVDFEHERREEVIQYIYRRYGRHRAAICATVIHYRSRSAIRDVGKALGLTDDITAALANTIWGSWGSHQDEEDDERARRDPHADRYKPTIPDPHIVQAGLDPNNPDIRRAIELATEILDFPRHLSQHVGGFVLTQNRLDETVPIGNAAMEDRTFIEWDKDDIDALQLMKVDVLALGMLTCIRRAFDLMNLHHGTDINDVAQIPAEEKPVYDMLSKADSLGVFQVESRAQMSMLPRLKPKCFYDLVIEVAIVRPGPIQGDMVHPYLRRRDGIEKVTYPSPAPEHGHPNELKEILNRTLGVPLFQEQAMSVAITAAKFTPEEANGLRRAMATFRNVGTMHLYEDLFISRMTQRGYALEFAKSQFNQIKGFGSYGFPESHAASFAQLVYASAWIKYHYPDVFCAAILNSQPMGFYQPAQLVRDAREHRVEVRAADVMASDWDCTLEPAQSGALKAVRLGLRLVDGLGEAEANKLIAARKAGARSPEEIAQRAGLARGVLDRIAEADAFRSNNLDRRAALWRVSGLKDQRTMLTDAPLLANLNLTGADDVPLPEMAKSEHVLEDYRTTGLSLKAHPVRFFRRALSERDGVRCGDLEKDDLPSGRFVRVAGLVLNRQRPGTASGVMFSTLEDETGIANLIVWPKVFEKQRVMFMTTRFLMVEGRLQKANGVTHVIVERGIDLTDKLALLRRDERPGAAAPKLQHSRDFH